MQPRERSIKDKEKEKKKQNSLIYLRVDLFRRTGWREDVMSTPLELLVSETETRNAIHLSSQGQNWTRHQV